ncbi:MAG TPA: response regulator transcription factor [Pseudogracilibacillus sp.]|nr:response regulator transcription factor [Pseudogracilibacillus sp.]
MLTILAVDDDPKLLDLVTIHLTKAGYDVIKAGNGEEALDETVDDLPDLAVVDVMMPKMDGFTLTKHLREMDVPVLLLTAKGEIEDKETGFLAGSDDYLVKPFEPKELLFRIQAILRRYDKTVHTIMEIGSMTINRQTYEVQIGKKTLFLPLKEFELLSVLASRANQVFTRDMLIERVWGLDYEGDDQTLNVHIKRLREKFRMHDTGAEIKTVRGVGYKLEVEES